VPPDETEPKADETLNTLDEPFVEEEITRPDHPRASVLCPECGGGNLPDNEVCTTCWGLERVNKEAFERWKRRR
jgi:hypothetical protein